MKKIIFVVVTTVFLNGCIQVVAMLGPAMTGISTGNVAHSALSYGFSYSVQKATGKTPIENVLSFTREKHKKKAKNDDLLKKLLSKDYITTTFGS